MNGKKPFIVELSNSQEMKLPWDEWDQKWLSHINYSYNINKINDSIFGVNAIANAVAHSAKNNHHALSFYISMLTISVYDF